MTSTDPSGLQITTTYYFKVNTVEYSILTGDPAPTFQEVADLMDAAVTSAGFSVVIVGDAPNQDIRVINEGDRGWESEIDLAYGTSGPNLWINLTGFVGFDPAVPGRGAFSIEIESSVEAGGKIQLGGAAAYNFINEPPVGSIIISGAVDIDTIEIVGTQGDPPTSIDLSGAGYYQIGYVYFPGGLVDLGTATYGDVVYGDTESSYMNQTVTSNIRMKLSGSADYELEIIATVEEGGKIQIGGTAETFADKIYEPSGGITLGGTVGVDEFTLEYDTSGAATLGGAADTESTANYAWVASGGMIFDGIADKTQEYVYQGVFYGDNYYKFNEFTGTTVNDAFASNDITLSAADLWTDDAVYGTAVQFDKADWSTFGTDVNPLAVSFWHKRKTVDQDSYRVFGASPDDQHWYFGYDLPYFRAMIRNGTNYFYFLDGSNYLVVPDDNEYHWYYIEFYSGSNAVAYVDNVYRGTTANFFGTATNQLHTIGNGGDDVSSGIYGFGPIDELRVYTSRRLDADEREQVYTLSPEPGTIVMGGSAKVQPVIVAGHEYLYTGKGGMKLSGSRYNYVVKSTEIVLSGTAPAELEYTYTGSGGITLQSVSTFHDFGLGYIYEASGLALSGGASDTTHTRDFEYTGSGGMTLKRTGEFIVIIIEGSYIVLFQEVGGVKLSGSAIVELEGITAPPPTGGVVMGGAIDDPVLGIVAKTPTGKVKLQGSADYEWAPNQGYQELGL